METTLIFHDGLELPHFAAFALLRDRGAGGRRSRATIAAYVAIARRDGRGLVLETPTWRSNPDWGGAARLFAPRRSTRSNAEAVDFVRGDPRRRRRRRPSPIVLSGAIGPRGDGYRPESLMTAAEAEAYHGRQVRVFEAAGADMVSAITMTYVEEAIGIARAAQAAGMPVGGLVHGRDRRAAALRHGRSARRSRPATRRPGGYPAYYMVNCAHPSHFRGGWRGAGVERIGGIRANASKMSHDELDEAPELDAGDPRELAEDYRELMRLLPRLRVLGGCCGTDHRHVGAISGACGHAHA